MMWRWMSRCCVYSHILKLKLKSWFLFEKKIMILFFFIILVLFVKKNDDVEVDEQVLYL